MKAKSDTRRRHLLLNTSVAFVLAGMIATTAHELSHLVTGLAMGEQPTLFPTSVDYSGDRSTDSQLITAAAGPLFSLVSGLLVILVASKWGRGFGRLLWMWLGFMSAEIGFGYFLIAPIASSGDTGRVLALLDAPEFASWISVLVGIAGTLLLSRLFATKVVQYSDGTDASIRAMGIFSWLVGTVVLVAVYVIALRNLAGDLLFISLMGIVAAGIFAPMFSFFYKKVSPEHEELVLGVPRVGIMATIALAVVIAVPLASGIALFS